MNELINLIGTAGLGNIQNLYGGVSGLLGGLTATAAGSAAASRPCGACRPACGSRCGNTSCIMPLAEVASVTDEVTYDVTVSSFVEVPMRVINFCPGKPRSCRRGCGCGCCCHCVGSCK